MRLTIIAILAFAATLASAGVAPLRRREAQSNPAPMISTLNGNWFDVEVQFGNQTFLLLVDTGSSDTWVAATGYHCISAEDNAELPQQECLWAPTYNIPSSIDYVANQTFGVQYGTGIALGRVGHEDVTLGGITVPRQTVGIVDSTTDLGDGLNSGILGLGYPALTSAHYGDTLANDTLLLNRARYDPLFVSMYKQGLVEPWYSLAIERPPRNTSTGPGGWLGLGELPPVRHSDEWAVAPVEITKGIPDIYYGGGDPEISLMTLSVESISWGHRSNASRITNSTSFQAVVDSGNNFNMVPAVIAESINAAFDPPGVLDEDTGVYMVECSAKAPALGVTIDSHTFWHKAEDLISRDMRGSCYSTLAPVEESDGISIHFLGDAFLRNVVAVFDFGKDEMRFAERTDGGQDDVPLTSSSTSSWLNGHVWGPMVSLSLFAHAMVYSM